MHTKSTKSKMLSQISQLSPKNKFSLLSHVLSKNIDNQSKNSKSLDSYLGEKTKKELEKKKEEYLKT